MRGPDISGVLTGYILWGPDISGIISGANLGTICEHCSKVLRGNIIPRIYPIPRPEIPVCTYLIFSHFSFQTTCEQPVAWDVLNMLVPNYVVISHQNHWGRRCTFSTPLYNLACYANRPNCCRKGNSNTATHLDIFCVWLFESSNEQPCLCPAIPNTSIHLVCALPIFSRLATFHTIKCSHAKNTK